MRIICCITDNLQSQPINKPFRAGNLTLVTQKENKAENLNSKTYYMKPKASMQNVKKVYLIVLNISETFGFTGHAWGCRNLLGSICYRFRTKPCLLISIFILS